MEGTLTHQPIRVQDDDGRLTRMVAFAPLAGPIGVRDTSGGFGARDLWDVSPRLQVDLNLRLDGSGGSSAWSPRAGIRYTPDDEGRTTLKASAGRNTVAGSSTSGSRSLRSLASSSSSMPAWPRPEAAW